MLYIVPSLDFMHCIFPLHIQNVVPFQKVKTCYILCTKICSYHEKFSCPQVSSSMGTGMRIQQWWLKICCSRNCLALTAQTLTSLHVTSLKGTCTSSELCIYLVAVCRAWAALMWSCLHICIHLVFPSFNISSLPLSHHLPVHTSVGKTVLLYSVQTPFLL